MRLKSKEDTVIQLFMCPKAHLFINSAVKSPKVVLNPSSVSFSVGEIKTQTLKKGLEKTVLTRLH